MERKYQEIFESFSIACVLLEGRNSDFRINNVTEEFCRLTGFTRQDLLGKVVGEHFQVPGQPEKFQLILDLLYNTREEGRNNTIPLLRFDLPEKGGNQQVEKYWCIHFAPLPRGATVPQYLLVKFLDKTGEVLEQRKRQQLQEELEKHSEERQLLIEENPDGLFSLDRKGRILSANEGLARITGVPRSELLHRDFPSLFRGEEQERIKELLTGPEKEETRECEMHYTSSSGESHFLRFNLMSLQVAGRLRGVYGIVKDITETRRSQELIQERDRELQRNKDQYRALVQEAFDLVGVLDKDAKYLFVSESAASILGVPPDFFIGKSAFDFIHPEDKERVMHAFSEIAAIKKMTIAPFRFLDSEGHWRWVETNVTNMLDDPSVQGVVTNSREVTELVKRNNDFQKLYERYKLAATATGDLIYDWDIESNVVKRFFKDNEKHFGYGKETLEQRNFWEAGIHPDEIQGLQELLEKSLGNPTRTQIRAQYRFRRSDGSYAHVFDRAMILRNGAGKAIRLIGAISDISGIINRRNALRMANQRFSYAMKATQEMIWDWDIKQDVIERGNSFNRIFGYDQKQQQTVSNFWFNRIFRKDQGRVRKSLEQALEDPATRKWQQEYRFRKLSGEKAYVIDRGYIIRDSRGKAIRMVGATLDVTASRRMLKEIKKQNRVLRDIAWEQAHVVRAPLARLKGLLALYEDDPGEAWDREEILQLIKQAADELDDIVMSIIRKTGEIGTEK